MAKNETIKIATLIGQGSVCDGDFKCNGSVRIDGTVNGEVTVSGMLVLGAAGEINGNITAKAVQIGGQVTGDINAPERAELTSTSKVIGNVTTNLIVIDENAVFQGAVNMNQDAPERKGGYLLRKAIRSGKRTAESAVNDALKDIESDSDITTESV